MRVALRMRIGLVILVWTLCAAGIRAADEAAPDAPADADESWQVIEMGGARVGYGHVATYHRQGEDGGDVIVSDTLTYMRIKRFNQAFEMTVRLHTEETDDGRLLGFHFRSDNPPISKMESRGTIRGGKLELQTGAGENVATTTTDWDTTIKSPAWQDRDLEEHPLKPGESRSFEMYDPQLNQVATITLTESGPAKTKLLDGREIDTTLILMSHSLVPISVNTFMDPNGEIVKTETSLLSMITYTVDRETALKEIEDQPVDLAVQTLVKVKPIEKAHDRQRIVYRITVPGGHPAEQFPNGSTQQVAKVSEHVADATVTRLAKDVPAGTEPPPDEKYLNPTRFLDSANEGVREHAGQAAAADLSPVDAAVAMEKYVHDEMHNKNYATGLATASEVAEKLEGDCTEHAVLLAAMLRARRIPSRVVVGLVYAESHAAFAGHMWTEAWLNGRWFPLDATLGEGGIGPAHIKIADSALDENAPTPIAAFLPMIPLLGQMSIEVLAVE